ncbi:MAG TPA: hypothetical protein VFA81_11235 [Burkholderiales bacterium]|nr:hypothetical protein [Burkholderiales bacterium]
MPKSHYAFIAFLCLGAFSPVAARTDVEADPVHYKLEFENDRVRVSRANFGPHEKMPSFFDPNSAVLVSLTDSEGLKLTFPDGKVTYTPPFRAGAAYWASAPQRQQQENAGDTRLEFIAIEPKGCKSRRCL